jgi:protein TonB
VAAIAERRATTSKQSVGRTDVVNVYLRRLHRALERHKVNPHTNIAGKVVVRVTIAPSGKMTSRDILESSGSTALDQAALASLDRVSALSALPASAEQTPFELAVPFKFNVR